MASSAATATSPGAVAGPRQVTVQAETALVAVTTPSSGGWIMFGKHLS